MSAPKENLNDSKRKIYKPIILTQQFAKKIIQDLIQEKRAAISNECTTKEQDGSLVEIIQTNFTAENEEDATESEEECSSTQEESDSSIEEGSDSSTEEGSDSSTEEGSNNSTEEGSNNSTEEGSDSSTEEESDSSTSNRSESQEENVSEDEGNDSTTSEEVDDNIGCGSKSKNKEKLSVVEKKENFSTKNKENANLEKEKRGTKNKISSNVEEQTFSETIAEKECLEDEEESTSDTEASTESESENISSNVEEQTFAEAIAEQECSENEDESTSDTEASTESESEKTSSNVEEQTFTEAIAEQECSENEDESTSDTEASTESESEKISSNVEEQIFSEAIAEKEYSEDGEESTSDTEASTESESEKISSNVEEQTFSEAIAEKECSEDEEESTSDTEANTESEDEGKSCDSSNDDENNVSENEEDSSSSGYNEGSSSSENEKQKDHFMHKKCVTFTKHAENIKDKIPPDISEYNKKIKVIPVVKTIENGKEEKEVDYHKNLKGNNCYQGQNEREMKSKKESEDECTENEVEIRNNENEDGLYQIMGFIVAKVTENIRNLTEDFNEKNKESESENFENKKAGENMEDKKQTDSVEIPKHIEKVEVKFNSDNIENAIEANSIEHNKDILGITVDEKKSNNVGDEMFENIKKGDKADITQSEIELKRNDVEQTERKKKEKQVGNLENGKAVENKNDTKQIDSIKDTKCIEIIEVGMKADSFEHAIKDNNTENRKEKFVIVMDEKKSDNVEDHMVENVRNGIKADIIHLEIETGNNNGETAGSTKNGEWAGNYENGKIIKNIDCNQIDGIKCLKRVDVGIKTDKCENQEENKEKINGTENDIKVDLRTEVEIKRKNRKNAESVKSKEQSGHFDSTNKAESTKDWKQNDSTEDLEHIEKDVEMKTANIKNTIGDNSTNDNKDKFINLVGKKKSCNSEVKEINNIGNENAADIYKREIEIKTNNSEKAERTTCEEQAWNYANEKAVQNKEGVDDWMSTDSSENQEESDDSGNEDESDTSEIEEESDTIESEEESDIIESEEETDTIESEEESDTIKSKGVRDLTQCEEVDSTENHIKVDSNNESYSSENDSNGSITHTVDTDSTENDSDIDEVSFASSEDDSNSNITHTIHIDSAENESDPDDVSFASSEVETTFGNTKVTVDIATGNTETSSSEYETESDSSNDENEYPVFEVLSIKTDSFQNTIISVNNKKMRISQKDLSKIYRDISKDNIETSSSKYDETKSESSKHDKEYPVPERPSSVSENEMKRNNAKSEIGTGFIENESNTDVVKTDSFGKNIISDNKKIGVGHKDILRIYRDISKDNIETSSSEYETKSDSSEGENESPVAKRTPYISENEIKGNNAKSKIDTDLIGSESNTDIVKTNSFESNIISDNNKKIRVGHKDMSKMYRYMSEDNIKASSSEYETKSDSSEDENECPVTKRTPYISENEMKENNAKSEIDTNFIGSESNTDIVKTDSFENNIISDNNKKMRVGHKDMSKIYQYISKDNIETNSSEYETKSDRSEDEDESPVTKRTPYISENEMKQNNAKSEIDTGFIESESNTGVVKTDSFENNIISDNKKIGVGHKDISRIYPDISKDNIETSSSEYETKSDSSEDETECPVAKRTPYISENEMKENNAEIKIDTDVIESESNTDMVKTDRFENNIGSDNNKKMTVGNTKGNIKTISSEYETKTESSKGENECPVAERTPDITENEMKENNAKSKMGTDFIESENNTDMVKIDSFEDNLISDNNKKITVGNTKDNIKTSCSEYETQAGSSKDENECPVAKRIPCISENEIKVNNAKSKIDTDFIGSESNTDIVKTNSFENNIVSNNNENIAVGNTKENIKTSSSEYETQSGSSKDEKECPEITPSFCDIEMKENNAKSKIDTDFIESESNRDMVKTDSFGNNVISDDNKKMTVGNIKDNIKTSSSEYETQSGSSKDENECPERTPSISENEMKENNAKSKTDTDFIESKSNTGMVKTDSFENNLISDNNKNMRVGNTQNNIEANSLEYEASDSSEDEIDFEVIDTSENAGEGNNLGGKMMTDITKKVEKSNSEISARKDEIEESCSSEDTEKSDDSEDDYSSESLEDSDDTENEKENDSSTSEEESVSSESVEESEISETEKNSFKNVKKHIVSKQMLCTNIKGIQSSQKTRQNEVIRNIIRINNLELSSIVDKDNETETRVKITVSDKLDTESGVKIAQKCGTDAVKVIKKSADEYKEEMKSEQNVSQDVFQQKSNILNSEISKEELKNVQDENKGKSEMKSRNIHIDKCTENIQGSSQIKTNVIPTYNIKEKGCSKDVKFREVCVKKPSKIEEPPPSPSKTDSYKLGEKHCVFFTNSMNKRVDDDALIWMLKVVKLYYLQLPYFSKEYLIRQVFDPKYYHIAVVERRHVHGAASFRVFSHQNFCELAFCATQPDVCHKGIASLIMAHLKEFNRVCSGVSHLVACVPESSIGFFMKQGFSSEVTLPMFISKNYLHRPSETTILEFLINEDINYYRLFRQWTVQYEILKRMIEMYENGVDFSDLDSELCFHIVSSNCNSSENKGNELELRLKHIQNNEAEIQDEHEHTDMDTDSNEVNIFLMSDTKDEENVNIDVQEIEVSTLKFEDFEETEECVHKLDGKHAKEMNYLSDKVLEHKDLETEVKRLLDSVNASVLLSKESNAEDDDSMETRKHLLESHLDGKEKFHKNVKDTSVTSHRQEENTEISKSILEHVEKSYEKEESKSGKSQNISGGLSVFEEILKPIIRHTMKPKAEKKTDNIPQLQKTVLERKPDDKEKCHKTAKYTCPAKELQRQEEKPEVSNSMFKQIEKSVVNKESSIDKGQSITKGAIDFETVELEDIMKSITEHVVKVEGKTGNLPQLQKTALKKEESKFMLDSHQADKEKSHKNAKESKNSNSQNISGNLSDFEAEVEKVFKPIMRPKAEKKTVPQLQKTVLEREPNAKEKSHKTAKDTCPAKELQRQEEIPEVSKSIFKQIEKSVVNEESNIDKGQNITEGAIDFETAKLEDIMKSITEHVVKVEEKTCNLPQLQKTALKKEESKLMSDSHQADKEKSHKNVKKSKNSNSQNISVNLSDFEAEVEKVLKPIMRPKAEKKTVPQLQKTVLEREPNAKEKSHKTAKDTCPAKELQRQEEIPEVSKSIFKQIEKSVVNEESNIDKGQNITEGAIDFETAELADIMKSITEHVVKVEEKTCNLPQLQKTALKKEESKLMSDSHQADKEKSHKNVKKSKNSNSQNISGNLSDFEAEVEKVLKPIMRPKAKKKTVPQLQKIILEKESNVKEKSHKTAKDTCPAKELQRQEEKPEVSKSMFKQIEKSVVNEESNIDKGQNISEGAIDFETVELEDIMKSITEHVGKVEGKTGNLPQLQKTALKKEESKLMLHSHQADKEKSHKNAKESKNSKSQNISGSLSDFEADVEKVLTPIIRPKAEEKTDSVPQLQKTVLEKEQNAKEKSHKTAKDTCPAKELQIQKEKPESSKSMFKQIEKSVVNKESSTDKGQNIAKGAIDFETVELEEILKLIIEHVVKAEEKTGNLLQLQETDLSKEDSKLRHDSHQADKEKSHKNTTDTYHATKLKSHLQATDLGRERMQIADPKSEPVGNFVAKVEENCNKIPLDHALPLEKKTNRQRKRKTEHMQISSTNVDENSKTQSPFEPDFKKLKVRDRSLRQNVGDNNLLDEKGEKSINRDASIAQLNNNSSNSSANSDQKNKYNLKDLRVMLVRLESCNLKGDKTVSERNLEEISDKDSSQAEVEVDQNDNNRDKSGSQVDSTNLRAKRKRDGSQSKDTLATAKKSKTNKDTVEGGRKKNRAKD